MTTKTQKVKQNKYITKVIFLFIPVIFLIMPNPEGLAPVAWKLFGFYLAAIFGLVAKPYPMPVVLLTTVAGSSILIGIAAKIDSAIKIDIKTVLSGYASSTTWLVYTAFALSAAFITTGLGKRVAYLMIRSYGSTTLRLGYIDAILDLMISPGMPSVTARGGGIMMPIMNSVAQSIGSDPETSPKKGGTFLLLNTFFSVKTTGYIFLTAMAPNALALTLLAPIVGIHVSWIQWFLAASVPGLFCLFVMPLILYTIYKPEVTKVDREEVANKGLQEMGAMKVSEKALLMIFILALLGWVTDKWTGIHSGAVALGAMVACLLLNVISWDNVLQNKTGWNTLIWYGGIIGLSTTLKKTGFFEWLGQTFSTLLGSGEFHGGYPMLLLILFMSVAIRYFFASGGAYIAAMMPVFALVGMATHVDPLLLTFGLLFSNAYGGVLTQYGSGPAPIIFGTGYATIKQWWIAGVIVGFGSLAIHSTIGVMWWKALHSMGLF